MEVQDPDCAKRKKRGNDRGLYLGYVSRICDAMLIGLSPGVAHRSGCMQ